jgi:PilZ domain-containing protein
MAKGGADQPVWFEDFARATHAPWFDEFAQANAQAAPPPAAKPVPSDRPAKPSDRRTSVRFRVDEANAWVQERTLVTLLRLSKRGLDGTVINLSEGGVLVRTDSRLELKSKLRVRIVFERFKDVIESNGEVRWSHEVPKKSTFLGGIQFVGLDPSIARKIRLMGEYFTSVQYKELREKRLREQNNRLIFPS